jgi:hypothetical protein
MTMNGKVSTSLWASIDIKLVIWPVVNCLRAELDNLRLFLITADMTADLAYKINSIEKPNCMNFSHLHIWPGYTSEHYSFERKC